ncbi:MAG: HIT family protein, partial [Sphaerochaeta sp.]|nr:HIT family protein [Sphaerochaeta sp.]
MKSSFFLAHIRLSSEGKGRDGKETTLSQRTWWIIVYLAFLCNPFSQHNPFPTRHLCATMALRCAMETIFTKILEGKIPSVRLHEDELCFVILDINPVNKGHLLIITKESYPLLS